MKKTFDDVVKWLKNEGFKRQSVQGPNHWVYINEDKSVSVTIEEHYEDKLTLEEEERIKKRLVELGYL